MPSVILVCCDRCDMVSVDGHACHQVGCPNDSARWDRDTESWVQQRECRDCGCTVDHDDPCCQVKVTK